MPEKKKKSRFPSEQAAHERRDRLPCFTRFFGESVSDTLGVVLTAESANRCQDCPDTDICFRLSLLKRLDQASENQQRLLSLLESTLRDGFRPH